MGTTATVGVGVIGRGFGRRVVAPVFAATAGCEVVDVVSPRDERRPACAPARVPTSISSRALAAVPATASTCAPRSRRARPCCATSRSGATPTRRARWKPLRATRACVALLQLRVPFPPGRARLRASSCRTARSERSSTCSGRASRRLPHAAAPVRLAVRPRAWRRLDRRVGFARDRLPALDLRRPGRRRRAHPGDRHRTARTATATVRRAPPRTRSPRGCAPRRRQRHHRHVVRHARRRSRRASPCSGPTACSSRSATSASPCARTKARPRSSPSTRRSKIRTWCRCGSGRRWYATRCARGRSPTASRRSATASSAPG